MRPLNLYFFTLKMFLKKNSYTAITYSNPSNSNLDSFIITITVVKHFNIFHTGYSGPVGHHQFEVLMGLQYSFIVIQIEIGLDRFVRTVFLNHIRNVFLDYKLDCYIH